MVTIFDYFKTVENAFLFIAGKVKTSIIAVMTHSLGSQERQRTCCASFPCPKGGSRLPGPPPGH